MWSQQSPYNVKAKMKSAHTNTESQDMEGVYEYYYDSYFLKYCF